MIAIPAVDIREGACVQLVGGSYENERVRLKDPVAVAKQWATAGFSRLHIVDLDAATNRGANRMVVRDILKAKTATAQVGGGVRSSERVSELLGDGARYVVAGTRAVEDRPWLEAVTAKHPDSIIVAADVRARTVVTHGWDKTEVLDVIAFVRETTALPIAGLLVTAVHKEGLMQGPDVQLVQDVVAAASVPVIASGGIGGMRDLVALAATGVAGVVIGMALYTGALDARRVAEEYGR